MILTQLLERGRRWVAFPKNTVRLQLVGMIQTTSEKSKRRRPNRLRLFRVLVDLQFHLLSMKACPYSYGECPKKHGAKCLLDSHPFLGKIV